MGLVLICVDIHLTLIAFEFETEPASVGELQEQWLMP